MGLGDDHNWLEHGVRYLVDRVGIRGLDQLKGVGLRPTGDCWVCPNLASSYEH